MLRKVLRERLLAVTAPGVLVVIGILAYSGTFHVPFIYDDYNAIVENPHIRSLWPLAEALSAPDESTIAGRPVVAFSLAVNHAVSGLDPWSYHVLNLLFHILCGLTLYGLVRRTLLTQRIASMRGVPGSGWAFAVAAIWLIHPLNTEVVTYVSTRTESLMSLFYLMTLYAVVRGGTGSRRTTLWYSLAVVSGMLAAASKEVAVTIPPVVLLYDAIFLSNGFRTALVRRRGLYIGLASSWLVSAGLWMAGPRGETVGTQFASLTPLDYARTQVSVIWHYLRLAFWPRPLVLDYYDWPVARSFSAGVWLGLVSLLALGLGSLWLIRARHWTGFLGGWFFLALAPSSSIIPIVSEVAAERRMYLSLMAVVALALAGVWWLAWHLAGRRAPALFASLAAATGVFFAALTMDRNRDYTDEVTIWERAVAERPANARALQNLAVALARHGRPRDAVPYLERALRIDQNAGYAIENLGLTRLEEGKLPEAVSLLTRGLKQRPDDAVSHLNLAKALLASGDSPAALAALQEAVRLQPGNALAHARLGLLLTDQGRLEEAALAVARAVGLDPENPVVGLCAAKSGLRRGAYAEALRHYQVVLRHDPGEKEAVLGMAAALRLSGRTKEAMAVLDRMAAVDPSAQRIIDLATFAGTTVDPDTGIDLLRAAIRRSPDTPELHLALGRLLAITRRSREALAEYLRALELRPRWADAGNSLVLLYATAEDPEVRNPGEAIRIARELCDAAADRHPVLLGSLGVALASAGRRGEAEGVIIKAADLARAAGQTELAFHLDRQLDRVRQGWPPAAEVADPQ